MEAWLKTCRTNGECSVNAAKFLFAVTCASGDDELAIEFARKAAHAMQLKKATVSLPLYKYGWNSNSSLALIRSFSTGAETIASLLRNQHKQLSYQQFSPLLFELLKLNFQYNLDYVKTNKHGYMDTVDFFANVWVLEYLARGASWCTIPSSNSSSNSSTNSISSREKVMQACFPNESMFQTANASIQHWYDELVAFIHSPQSTMDFRY
jgi:hypothetical protein